VPDSAHLVDKGLEGVMVVRQQITKAAPVVKTLLGLFGVPAGLVSAVELAGEVAGFTPGQAAVVRSFAARAAESLEEHCAREFREVGDADKQALVGQLNEALGRCQRDGSLLIAGVEGVAQVRTLLVDEPVSRFLAQWQQWADQRGFFDGLLGRVSVLCRAWVRDRDVAQLATLNRSALSCTGWVICRPRSTVCPPRRQRPSGTC